jgi:hypothetical protein
MILPKPTEYTRRWGVYTLPLQVIDNDQWYAHSSHIYVFSGHFLGDAGIKYGSLGEAQGQSTLDICLEAARKTGILMEY